MCIVEASDPVYDINHMAFKGFGEMFRSVLPERHETTPAAFEQLINDYVLKGGMSPDELCKKISVDHVDEFVHAFERMLSQLQEARGRSSVFRLQQIENMITRGMEESVCRAQGVPFIKKAA
jgi:hypothetical protein